MPGEALEIPIAVERAIGPGGRDLEGIVPADGVVDVQLSRHLAAHPGAVVETDPPLLVDVKSQDQARSLPAEFEVDELEPGERDDPGDDGLDSGQDVVLHAPHRGTTWGPSPRHVPRK